MSSWSSGYGDGEGSAEPSVAIGHGRSYYGCIPLYGYGAPGSGGDIISFSAYCNEGSGYPFGRPDGGDDYSRQRGWGRPGGRFRGWSPLSEGGFHKEENNR